MWCEFQLKELEKLGPKKGVISQSVKDVVQTLVDDDLVLKDKIGTSVSKFLQAVVTYTNTFLLFWYSAWPSYFECFCII